MLKRKITITLLSAAMLLASGCGKDTSVLSGAGVIRYGVSVTGQEPGRRAALVNDETTFQTNPGKFTCSAYNVTDGKSLYSDKTVAWSAGKWTTDTQYTWENGKTMTFHAFAPTTASGVSIAADGIGITATDYAIADDASGQTDLMLGYYSGTGGNTGTATIKFDHPLTAVRFKMGDIAEFVPGFSQITSITMEGVAASGTLAQWSGSTFSWTPSSTTKTVTLTVGSKPASGAFITDQAFTLIPQTFSSSAKVTIKVNYTATTSGYISASIDSGTWEAGKAYTYVVNFKTLVLTINDAGAVTNWTTDTTQSPIDAEDAQ